ncbi:MAG TPA: heterodisulfide reductase [Gammaproteobacteria bacterium]|nr:heterodisulfide reductase [Gammaproteobacteria bacterium]
MSDSLERGLEAMRGQMDARVMSYMSTCVHCGICADACLFYTETGDARYTPIYKTEPLRKLWRQEYTFWGKLAASMGLSKKLTEQDLADWEELVYDGCTMCSRCSMVCPVGVDIAYMIRKVKEGLSAAGFSPGDLVEAGKRAVEIGSPMGVTLKTLEATIRAQEKETGLKMPLDVEGADYLCLFSSGEIAGFPEFIGSLAKIFKAGDVSWTISSDYFEATNTGVQLGNSGMAATLVERVVAAAEKLKVKYVISPECGHAYTTLRWDAPNFIGRPLPFKVVHIMELLDELRRDDRLKTEGFTNEKLSYHDPCNAGRRGGVLDQPRKLLNMVAPNFVELPETGAMNWCCGGGGGVSSNERADELRLKVFSAKKRQLDAVNVEGLVTACSNCRHMLEDGLEDNEMYEVELLGITELIADHLAGDGV